MITSASLSVLFDNLFSKYMCSNHCFKLSSIHFKIRSLCYASYDSVLSTSVFWFWVVHKAFLFLAVCRICSTGCVSNAEKRRRSISWKCTFGKAAVEPSLWVCQQSYQNKNSNRYDHFIQTSPSAIATSLNNMCLQLKSISCANTVGQLSVLKKYSPRKLNFLT